MGLDLIERALQAQLIETFKDPNYRPPPLPQVAIQLSGMTHGDDATIAHVVSLLEQDPMLAGAVFRLVASPLYASRTPITSLQQAVVRLGLRSIRSIVFEVVLRRGVFDLPDYGETVEQLRRHSTTAAYVARIIGTECGVDPDNGFICGLLHDIGFSALLFSVSNRPKGESPRLEAVWRDVDDTHERASMLVSRMWNLPAEIYEVVGHHHHFERCANEEAKRVAACVCIADGLTGRFGANVTGPVDAKGVLIEADAVSTESVDAARALLEIDDLSLERIIDKAEMMVPEILWV